MTHHPSPITHHGLPKAPLLISVIMLLIAADGCGGTPKAVLEEANRQTKGFLLGPEDVQIGRASCRERV